MKTNYEIAYEDSFIVFIVDRSDDPPGYMTVTNDARAVVKSLDLMGRRLYYRDTAGDIDEIKHRDGHFIGFAPGPDWEVKSKLLAHVD